MMSHILVLCFLANLGVSLAAQCPPDHTKQKLKFLPTNEFYTLNLFANGNNWPNQTERDAVLNSGRSIWMKANACFKIKPDDPGMLMQICGATKFADTIIFKYVQDDVEMTEIIAAGPITEFSNKCFNKGDPLIDDVSDMQICFGATQDVKFKDAFAAMCVPNDPDETPLTDVAFSVFAELFTTYDPLEKLNFTGIIINDGNAFDGISTFTCPVHGIYVFSVVIKKVNSEVFVPNSDFDLVDYVEIFRDDEFIMQVWGDGDDISDIVSAVGTIVLECDVGQTVHVAAGNHTITVFGGPERESVFSGFLLYPK